MNLITVQQIIDEVVVRKNVDPVLIESDILLAQERYIKDALGYKLYDEIVAQFEGGQDSDSDTDPLSSVNQTLLETYIRPALARYVIYEAIPTMHLDIGSQGIMKNFTDYSHQHSKGDVSYLRDVMLNKADFFRDRMIKFIEDNIADYPLYKECKGLGHKHKYTSFIIH